MVTDAGSLGSEVNLPRRADQSVIDGYVSMCRSHGFTLLGRHLITRERPISIENEKTLKIPGRMRPRFPQLDDATIRRLFLEASAQAQSDTGVTTLVKSRVFFILAVLGRPAQPAVPGPSMRWARNTRPSNY